LRLRNLWLIRLETWLGMLIITGITRQERHRLA
jgi:hypothetical protein